MINSLTDPLFDEIFSKVALTGSTFYLFAIVLVMCC